MEDNVVNDLWPGANVYRAYQLSVKNAVIPGISYSLENKGCGCGLKG